MILSKVKKKQDDGYYSLDRILKRKATYNVIIGERSNGKTYSVLKYAVEQYFKGKGQLAIVRRWVPDLQGRRASDIFSAINNDGVVQEASGGEYDAIVYYAGKFYPAVWDDDKGKYIYSLDRVFAYTFALSENEHNKSISYPGVTTILFDEFIAQRNYLKDEFVAWMNTVSTIIRQREGVKIFMLGNTINKYAPYFDEMGLTHVTKQQQGTIDIYTYGDSKLTVAVEYCSTAKAKKKNNYYYAFDNPKLKMITDGAWELDIYPHLPYKYKPSDILLTYFIIFREEIFQCEIVDLEDEGNGIFTYIHRKTTPIQDDNNDLIYSLDYNSKLNYNRNIYKPFTKMQERILWFFKMDKVFYQDNEVGNSIDNYLSICRTGRR